MQQKSSHSLPRPNRPAMSQPLNNRPLMRQTGQAKTIAALLLLVLICGATGFGGYLLWQKYGAGEPVFHGSIPPQRIPLPAFTLQTDDQQTFTKANLGGEDNDRWSLWFFGFTRCPDVCPNTLGAMQTAGLGEIENLQIVLVTVDPERDTPEALHKYLSYYPLDAIGLTGTTEELTKLNSRIGMPVERLPLENGDYTMVHSASLWLIDPQGNIAAKLDYPHQPEQMRETIPALLDYFNR